MITRAWGHYTRTAHAGVVIKHLTITAGHRLKFKKNRSYHRYIYVISGSACVNSLDSSSDIEHTGTYTATNSIWIGCDTWYQIINAADQDLMLLEVKYR